MIDRKPQINFQVEPALKTLYDEARETAGHWVTRLCAAGLLILVEDAELRARALGRLREWEVEYADASDAKIRAFVMGQRGSIRSRPPGNAPGKKSRPGRKGAKELRGE